MYLKRAVDSLLHLKQQHLVFFIGKQKPHAGAPPLGFSSHCGWISVSGFYCSHSSDRNESRMSSAETHSIMSDPPPPLSEPEAHLACIRLVRDSLLIPARPIFDFRNIIYSQYSQTTCGELERESLTIIIESP